MPDIALRDIVAFLTAAGLIGGIVIAWVRWQLSGDFAKSSDISALSTRVQQIERQMEGVPTHSDLRALHDRLGQTERGVAVANAQIEGVREGVGRVERQVTLLVEHQLKDGK